MSSLTASIATSYNLPLACEDCKEKFTTIVYPPDLSGPYCNECYKKRYLDVPPMPQEHDPVNHPRHYKNHPSGIECITVAEHMNFCLGNALKYIWRAGEKDDQIQDLEKAAWYLSREITRLKKQKANGTQ